MSVGKLGSFDVVLGSYILNYAQNADELAAFCRTIAANLAAGGRFVGMNDNPFNKPESFASYRPYGFVKESPTPRREGDAVTYVMFRDDGTSFSFNNFFLSPSTYESVFARFFKGFRWHAPNVVRAGVAAHGADFWKAWGADPPVIGVELW